MEEQPKLPQAAKECAWGFTCGTWVKIKPAGIGPQVLVLGSIYQGSTSSTDF